MPEQPSSEQTIVVESIQIGGAQPTPASSVGETGIDKRYVDTATVSVDGLIGDTICDVEHHGGPDQAVYVYMRDDYTHWESELGRPLPGGAFGENITIAGIGSADVMVGDRFTIGDIVLEACSTRIPCRTFQHHVQEDDWVARFRDARRPGVYCRVVAPGQVVSGAAVTHTPATGTISILETQDIYYNTSAEPDRLLEALQSPLAIRTRALIERRLSRS